MAFDQSGPRWLGISDLIAEPEGPTFISHKVARSLLNRLRFVTQDPERKFGLVTKFDILIRAKRNGLERPSERALQSLTGVRIEPTPVAEDDAFWLP